VRLFWFRGVTAAAAAVLAVSMVALNVAFETAGSISDLGPCGFLAGNLLALLALYPIAAAVVTGRAARVLARRFPEADEEIVRMGGRAGTLGAVAYFAGGLMTLLTTGRASETPLTVAFVLPLYTFLCYLAGRFGASLTVEKSAHIALQSSEG
jgi:hypothetical protein